MLKVKKEVKELCLEFIKEKTGTTRWKELLRELEYKWKFTAFNLLALFGNPPTIEYNDDNFSLVLEEEK
ncbi:hypothetical protein ES708_05813 [subsurface metagenome]